jgi:hypothetical protein
LHNYFRLKVPRGNSEHNWQRTDGLGGSLIALRMYSTAFEHEDISEYCALIKN